MPPPAGHTAKRKPDGSPGEDDDKRETKSAMVDDDAEGGVNEDPAMADADTAGGALQMQNAPRSTTPPVPDTPPGARQAAFQSAMADAVPPPATVEEHAAAATGREPPEPPTLEMHRQAVREIVKVPIPWIRKSIHTQELSKATAM